MFFRHSCTILSIIFLLLSQQSAIALVWNVPITSPDSASVWKAGGTYTVKWNTTANGQTVPDGINGTIKLGYFDEQDMPNEHLYWTLASGFPLSQGFQIVSLPSDLDTKSSYIIIVMGDSGNASPQFSIQGQGQG